MSSAELTDVVVRVANASTPPDALHEVGVALLRQTESQCVTILVVNEEAGHLEQRWHFGPAETSVRGRETIERVSWTGRVAIASEDGGSAMAVPARDRHGRIIAVISAEASRSAAYGERERELGLSLASLAAMTLVEQAHQQREEALLQTATAITAAVSEEALIGKVVEVAEHVLRLQACSIFLIDPATDRFVLRGTSGRLRDLVGRVFYSRNEGFTGWVCENKRPILLHDPHGDPRWRGKYVEFASDQVASFLAVPIVSRGQGIGAIRVLRRKSENRLLDNRFHQDDQRLLQAIAEQLAIGLESVRGTERRIRDERMIAWGELSAKSSHMIGNRVFALKGDINEMGHLVEEDPPDLPSLIEVQQSLQVNVTRIEEILHDFRDFVTATQLDRSPTDLNQLVRETAEEVFPKRGAVALKMDLLDDTLTTSVDGKRLRRAVSELIENSLLHTSQGWLRIQTRRTEDGNGVRIIVEDTGPGVPLEKKALIFQPFFSGRVRGMGLGLSIVQGIVAAHGGTVHEDGRPGMGARFVLTLPMTGSAHPS